MTIDYERSTRVPASDANVSDKISYPFVLNFSNQIRSNHDSAPLSLALAYSTETTPLTPRAIGITNLAQIRNRTGPSISNSTRCKTRQLIVFHQHFQQNKSTNPCKSADQF